MSSFTTIQPAFSEKGLESSNSSSSNTPPPILKKNPPLPKKTSPPPLPPNEINLIVDTSGSMRSIIKATCDSLNNYILEQSQEQKDNANNIIVTLTTFSTNVEQHWSKPLSEIPQIENVVPSGLTALYDAIGMTLENKDPNKSNIVCILTDGDENSSVNYTAYIIKEKIKQLENKGWTFLFFGANQDALMVGENLGINKETCMTFDADSECMAPLSRAMSEATTRRTRGLPVSFSIDERTSCRRENLSSKSLTCPPKIYGDDDKKHNPASANNDGWNILLDNP